MKKSLFIAFVMAGGLASATEPFSLRTKPLFTEKSTTEKSTAPAMRKNFDGEPNIAVKWNVTQLAFKNISLMGEYGFHKNFSGGLGFSYLLQRPLPGLLYTENQYFDVPEYKGWAITPEVRWYPSRKEERTAPNGFYIALYARYAKYTMSQNARYTDNGKTYTGTGTSIYKGMTGGWMIGRQWVFDGGFSLDWWIVGGGAGKASFSYVWTSPDANLTTTQQADLKTQYVDYFGNMVLPGGDAIEITTTPKSAKATVKGIPMASIRFMGLCLGYAF